MTTAPNKLSVLLTCATAIAGATLSVDASAYTLTKYTASPVAMNFPAILGAPGNDNEIPPVILVHGNSHDYFVSGYMSYSCLGNWGMFDSGMHWFTTCSELLGAVVDNVQTGYLTESSVDQMESMADETTAYKRNFNGIFSVVQYDDPASSSGVSLLALTHDENKGEAKALAGGGVGSFRTSVPLRSITNLVNGDTGQTCIHETNGCYFAFVSAATIPYTGASNYGHNPQWTDYGPIAWPSQGYISPDGTLKIANGPRHPHAIIVGSYVYVFYQDMYYTNGADGLYSLDVGDRRGGMKVIRAQLPNVQPGNWYAYFQPAGASAGDFTEPALPNGSASFSLPGPRATPLFTNIADPNHGNYEGLSFAVAQVRGQNLYVGVEEYADWGLEGPVMCAGNMRVALRTSTDLIHWSARIPLYDGCQDYPNFALNLPEFVDASSTSNTQIDLNNFYVVGNKPFHYYYMHVGLAP